jgi:hypothetical protein
MIHFSFSSIQFKQASRIVVFVHLLRSFVDCCIQGVPRLNAAAGRRKGMTNKKEQLFI